MPTFEELQALGAVPSGEPAASSRGLTFEQLTQMGAQPATAAEGSTGQDFARGALQGASLGFGDEAAAAIDAGVSKIPGLRNLAQHFHSSDLPPLTGDATYQERRDAYRQKNAEARQNSPYAYLGGELAGGLATTPLVPGGSAKTLVQAVSKGVKTGAALGGLNALGTSSADLTKGEVTDAGEDIVKGAALGGLFGGGLGAVGHAAGRALTGNAERLKKWIGADLVGEARGASTTTAKVQLSNDLDDIADVVSKDPALDRAVFAAQRQHPDAVGNALDAVNAKIKTVTEPRGELWQQFDQELGAEGGTPGVRAGDYIDHLENSVKELRATGKGSDRAIAGELQHHISEIKTARDWGYQPGPGSAEEEQILSNIQAQRTARLARGESTAEVDKAIRDLSSGNETFDPDHIVPAVRVRDDVTDLQKEAAQRMGGIHGTPNYLRGREVASHGEDFLRGLMDRVSERNPELGAQIAEHNRVYSALANMRQILEQRLQRAKVDDIGGLGTGVIAKATKLGTKHGVVKAGSLMAGRAMVSGIRAGQRAGANLEASAASGDRFSVLVLDGLRKGLPLAASVAAAEAAGRAAGD